MPLTGSCSSHTYPIIRNIPPRADALSIVDDLDGRDLGGTGLQAMLNVPSGAAAAATAVGGPDHALSLTMH